MYLRLIFLFMCLTYCLPKKGLTQHYYEAIGLRAGTTTGLTYKRFLDKQYDIMHHAIEGIIGIQLDEVNQKQNGYIVEGVYKFQTKLGIYSRFSAYAGAGIFTGVYTVQGESIRFGGGLSLPFGVEYALKFIPLCIAAEWKPILGSPQSSLSKGALSFRYILQ